MLEAHALNLQLDDTTDPDEILRLSIRINRIYRDHWDHLSEAEQAQEAAECAERFAAICELVEQRIKQLDQTYPQRTNP